MVARSTFSRFLTTRRRSAANRYEYRRAIEQWLAADAVVVCDRYLASSVAYGEAQGLDPAWLETIQRHLPQPSLTVLLDIPPEASLARKQRDRDRYERDLSLLGRVRESYLRQAAQPQWLHLDGAQEKDAVTREVVNAVGSRLALL
jgi:dTMP kinase